MQDEIVKITLELTKEESLALAQFLKRAGWSEYRSNAVDDNEAYLIKDALEKVRKSVNLAGFKPR